MSTALSVTGTGFDAERRNQTGCLMLLLNSNRIKTIIRRFSAMAVLSVFDFYAPPQFRKAEVAAAPRRSFGSLRGLVAPAVDNGGLLCASKSANLRLAMTKNPLSFSFCFIMYNLSLTDAAVSPVDRLPHLSSARRIMFSANPPCE